MGITLSDEAMRVVQAFEDLSGVAARDCVVRADRVLLVVAPEDMGLAIGRDGETVRAFEDRMGTAVRVVADADWPEDFVANALAPAAVYDVEIEDGVATVSVAPEDRGVAIGEGGSRIEDATVLAARHTGVEEIRLEEEPRNGDA